MRKPCAPATSRAPQLVVHGCANDEESKDRLKRSDQSETESGLQRCQGKQHGEHERAAGKIDKDRGGHARWRLAVAEEFAKEVVRQRDETGEFEKPEVAGETLVPRTPVPKPVENNRPDEHESEVLQPFAGVAHGVPQSETGETGEGKVQEISRDE